MSDRELARQKLKGNFGAILLAVGIKQFGNQRFELGR